MALNNNDKAFIARIAALDIAHNKLCTIFSRSHEIVIVNEKKDCYS